MDVLQSPITFRPAAELTLAALADLYTRCFDGYPYPVRIAPEALERRIRSEQIDLARSPLICAGDEPAGVALLGLRGAEANCAGFGVTEPCRGGGLARLLLAEHLRLARAAGGRRITLMVLAGNGGALRAYLRAGMRVARNLLWLEWRAPAGPLPDDDEVIAAAPQVLLAHFHALPRAAPFWQRDLPTLRALDGLEGWALPGAAGPAAYALVAPAPAAAPILDLAARGPAEATRLITALQARYAALSINEPAESPMIPALHAAGFVKTYLRHELEMAL